jgi:WD40 repeat protein
VCPNPLSHHCCRITCVSFSDDCTLLATGGDDSLVRVVSLTDRDLKTLFPGPEIEKMNVERT